MKKLIFVLIISVFCVSGCLSRSVSYQTNYNFGEIDKIAIVAVEGQVKNSEAKAQIADLFVMEILNKGYAPIPLAQVNAKIRAMAGSEEPLEVPQDAYAQIGKILKVPAVLVINIPYFDDEISISAQLINAKDEGSVLWMEQESGETGNQGRETLKRKNQEDYLMDPLLMLQEQTKEPKTQEVPVKPGERPLNPQELQNTKMLVSKICSSLPSAASSKAEKTLSATSTKTNSKSRTTSDW